jgi:MFS family permease
MAPPEPAGNGVADPPSSPPRLRGNRDFWLYLAGNTGGWAGLGAADVLLLWLVYSATGSTLAVAAIGLAEAIPPIAIGFFAGVLSDRYDRRRLLFLTAVAQAGVLGLVPLSLAAFGFRLWIVVALVVALETATVVFRQAATATLPALVHHEGLDSANALTLGVTSVASTSAAALAAILLTVVGITGGLGVDFVVFAVGAIFLALIAHPTRSRPVPVPVAPRALRHELAEAVGFLRAHPWLLDLTLFSAAAGFFVTMFSPYLVVYTVQALRLPANIFGYLIGGYSAGFFVGSLLAARLHVVRYYGPFFGLGLLGSGGLLGLLVLLPSFSTALVALAALGVLMGTLLTGLITLVQRTVPTELLGRYLGLEETLAWAVAPFGVVIGGLLTQELGVRDGFGIAALGLVGIGALALGSGRLRAVGYRASGLPAGSITSPGSGPVGPLPDIEDRGGQSAAEPSTVLDEIRA